ncbi:MAG: M57 family metalloprotease [Myxococcales bacterium]|nr:M57 family metalloprotease [Myxococcales bacterium]
MSQRSTIEIGRSAVLALCMMHLLGACLETSPEAAASAEDGDTEVARENDEILALLEERGVPLERVEIGERYVVYEDDILIDRQDLLDQARGTVPKAYWLANYSDDNDHPEGSVNGYPITETDTFAYWFSAPPVSAFIVDDLYLMPQAADVPAGHPAEGLYLNSDWQDAFEYAAEKWSEVYISFFGFPLQSRISIDYGFRFGRPWGSQINIRYCDISWPTIGQGQAPSWGLPGQNICVNRDFDSSPDSLKRSVAIHEIGHTLGFAHCNTGFSNSVVIPGTDDGVCGIEAVMFSGSSSEEFTDDERLGIVTMYPPD